MILKIETADLGAARIGDRVGDHARPHLLVVRVGAVPRINVVAVLNQASAGMEVERDRIL